MKSYSQEQLIRAKALMKRYMTPETRDATRKNPWFYEAMAICDMEYGFPDWDVSLTTKESVNAFLAKVKQRANDCE